MGEWGEQTTGDLSPDKIEGALTTRWLGRHLLYFHQVSSTNDVAIEQAAAGAAQGLLILAEEQTAGRGRLDRSWWAPPGSSLLMSLLLRPMLPPSRVAQLTMCLGLAAVEGIEETTGLRVALKWPNDVVWQGRKLAGMLTELRLSGEHLEYVVLGLGLNVNFVFPGAPGAAQPPAAAPLAVPPDVAQAAASLQMALGRPVPRLPLLIAILSHCETWYERLQAGSLPHRAWAARLDTLGRRIKVRMPDGELVGTAIDVTPEGALRVQADDGRVHTVWAGDVIALRASP
jgi:BirA family biotin operon repressor/biotin-[acetyl-CoA-carboxylase] ligase